MGQRGVLGSVLNTEWAAPSAQSQRVVAIGTRSRTSRLTWHHVAPFMSVAIISVSLFFVAFAKMEVRRLGYSVWKLSREERHLRDLDRDLQIQLAKATRPERLATVAAHTLTLRQAEKGQIIQMTESGVALEQ